MAPDSEDAQAITPWEKTDEALDAAAELMAACDDDADDEGSPDEADDTAPESGDPS